MESAIISGNSKKDIQLLVAVAEKMGIKARLLTKDDLDDFAMAKAIDEGKTGEYVDTAEFFEIIEMIIKIDKSFQKDLNRINDAKTKDAIVEIIEALQSVETFSSVSNLKKLAGHQNKYRIRLGNYRIGLEYTKDNELVLIRFLHRKEIYQRWP